MKNKKIIALALALSIVFATISLTSVSVFAENDYSELFAQRREYFRAKFYENRESDYYFEQLRHNLKPTYMGIDNYITPLFLPIIYTEAAKDFTYIPVKHYEDIVNGEDLCGESAHLIFHKFPDYYVISPQIVEAIQKCFSWGDGHLIISGGEGLSGSFLKTCIDAFDISKEEFKEAIRICEEDPDSIRSKFSFMSDEDFEQFKIYAKESVKSIPDFIIEALYIEDKAISENLICSPWAFYVKEVDQLVTTEMLGKRRMDYGNDYMMSVEELIQCDLTSEAAGMFVDYYKYILIELAKESNDVRKEDVYVYNLLKDARAKQLAVETGEELIFIPLAVISLAGAVAIVSPKLRRKLKKAE